jgi:hypothetical protein
MAQSSTMLQRAARARNRFWRSAAALVFLSSLLAVSVQGLSQNPAAAAPHPSHSIAYVYDFGAGLNDPQFTGSSVFVNAITGTPPGSGDSATYTGTTPAGTATYTLTNVPIASLDANPATVLNGYDTVLLYEVCTIGTPVNARALSAINTFLQNGGKVIILDGDRCSPGNGGAPDYSNFAFPFQSNNPGPQGASGSYTSIEASTLTAGLASGPQPGDAVGDGNILTTRDPAWFEAIGATNVNATAGPIEAYARTASGGLALFEGEDFWYTFGASPHLRQVFDLLLGQEWNPDGLPSTTPIAAVSTHIVVMGDSYASGEGTYNAHTNSVDYYPDSKTTSNTCHISPGGYGPLMGIAEADIAACSGATIDQMINGGGGCCGGNGGPSQLQILDGSVTGVLLSAGGDDLGFAGVLDACTDIPLIHPHGHEACVDAVNQGEANIPSTMTRLQGLIARIGSLTSPPGAPQGARVFLVGYPHIFPPGGHGGCNHISKPNQIILNQATDKLDQALSQVASQSANAQFVDVRSVFAGHEICGNSDPYINDLQLDIGPVRNCPDPYIAFDFVCSQSYHPNTAGWAAEADFLRGVLTQYAASVGTDCVTRTRPPTSAEPGITGDYRLGDNGTQPAPTTGPTSGPGPFAPLGGVYANVLNCSPWVEPGSDVSAWVMLQQFGDANSYVQAGWLENAGGRRTSLVELQDEVTQARAAFGVSNYTYERCDNPASLSSLTCPSNSSSPYPLPTAPVNFSTFYTIEFHPYASPQNRVLIVTENLSLFSPAPTDPRCTVSVQGPIPHQHVVCRQPFVEYGTFHIFIAQPGSPARTEIASAPARFIPNQANLAGETHNGFDQMPGTLSKPETFDSAHVWDRGGWVGFDGSSQYNGAAFDNNFYGDALSGSADPLGSEGQLVKIWDPRI